MTLLNLTLEIVLAGSAKTVIRDVTLSPKSEVPRAACRLIAQIPWLQSEDV